MGRGKGEGAEHRRTYPTMYERVVSQLLRTEFRSARSHLEGCRLAPSRIHRWSLPSQQRQGGNSLVRPESERKSVKPMIAVGFLSVRGGFWVSKKSKWSRVGLMEVCGGVESRPQIFLNLNSVQFGQLFRLKAGEVEERFRRLDSPAQAT